MPLPLEAKPESLETPLKPLSIGPIEIGFPVVQAALSGYSDWPMRVIAKRLGAPYTICEVMLDQFLVQMKDRKKTGHFLHNTAEETPVGGQLMGADPIQFAEGAVKLVEAGFDIIDINFGCPVKKVLGRCRGGYHLGQPDVALDIIKRTRDAVPSEIPVSVKMRRGIDDSDESRDNFFHDHRRCFCCWLGSGDGPRQNRQAEVRGAQPLGISEGIESPVSAADDFGKWRPVHTC